MYRNYLSAIQNFEEYGDKYGDYDIIRMYEKELGIMERYNIKIKTKEGTYEYEKEDLSDIDLLLMKHPDYEEIKAEKEKPKCKKKVLKKP